MPVPKRRTSRSRRDSRRAHHDKVPPVGRSLCPQCGEPKLPHRVCTHCGTYRGEDILHLDKKSAKA